MPTMTGTRSFASWRSTFCRSPWPEVAVLAVALATRFWRSARHSVWFDEAVSLKWAEADPTYTWRVAFALVEEKHPPVYYLALHYWQQFLSFFGLAQNDAALRAFGGILGALTALGIMLLARRLSGRAVGLLAGALIALAPVLVWYSQELRMFQPAATAIVWAAFALDAAWRAPSFSKRLLWWVSFIVFLELALYSYLFSAFILPAAGLTVLALALQRRSPRFFVEGALALALTGLLFLPLALNAWAVNAAESTPGQAFANLLPNVARLIRVYTVWRAPWSGTVIVSLTFVFGALALLGLGLAYPRQRCATRLTALGVDQWWLILWLGAPWLIANILLARSGSIFSQDRYLLFMAPFFLWAVARGVAAIASRATIALWALGPAALIALALTLPVLWTPATARENWRAAAAYILDYQQASQNLPAAVVTHVDYTHAPLEWYLRQKVSFDDLPVFFPFGGTLDPSETETVIAPPLLGIVDFGAHTLWLTQSHLEGVDEDRLIEQWLAQHFPAITEQYPAGIKLSGYMLRYRYEDLPALGPHAARPATELAPGITLTACEVTAQPVRAKDVDMHPPSGWVHVRLWWHTDQPPAHDYVTTAQVIGPEGVWGDRLYRENETKAFWPSSQWVAGEYVREEIDINLNPLTPPGVYPVYIGLTGPDGSDVSAPVMCAEVEIH